MSQTATTGVGDALQSGQLPPTYPATNATVLRLMTEERDRFTTLINQLSSRIDNLSLTAYEDIVSTVTAHTSDTTVHITAQERAAWNAIPSAATFQAHVASTSVHITAADRTAWTGKQDALTFDAAPTAQSGNPVTSAGIKSYVDGVAATLGTRIDGCATTAYLATQLAAYSTTSAITTLLGGYVTSAAHASALDGKVDKVTGKGLSKNDFTDQLLAKLNGITAGAQPNVITSITVDGQVVQPVGKDVAISLSGKVDKVAGKGLSEADFTSAEKTKLAGVATGAQANVIEHVTVNGTEVTPSNKTVAITIPDAQSPLVQNGMFFMPNGIENGKQLYVPLKIVNGVMEFGLVSYERNANGVFVQHT